MIWFISDEHYWHKRVIRLCTRPFDSLDEMHRILIRNHNIRVKPEDTVIHVGDFSWGSTTKTKSILDQLNGTHILIMGNHDKGSHITAMNAGFVWACTEMQMHLEGEKIIIKHYPYKPHWLFRMKNFLIYHYNLRYLDRRPKNEGGWLIHGHTHSSQKLKEKSIHVGVDAWNFKPVSLNQIIRIIRKKTTE